MSSGDVTREGLRGVRPGREATTATTVPPGHGNGAIRRRPRGGERAMVPETEFRSYYGKPILNQPTWAAPDIPGYLFLGGLAGAGSVIAAAAQATRRPGLARTTKLGAASAAGLSLVALIHDLGYRRRFLNMLRTFKPTSPMSVGTWLLSTYGPAAATAAMADLTGAFPGLGTLATVGAAALGPAVACYTGALISDTAVPAWHDGHRTMPFLFAASAASAAAGLGMVGAPVTEAAPVRRLAVIAAGAELMAEKVLEREMGPAGETYHQGQAERCGRAARALVMAGMAGTVLFGRSSRLASVLSGAAIMGASALTRFSVFEAGRISARDPKYTVVPQRRRVDGPGPAGCPT